MRYPNVKSLYFATPVVFNALGEGVSLGQPNLRKILRGGQRMAKVQNDDKSFKPLSRADERYRRICDWQRPERDVVNI